MVGILRRPTLSRITFVGALEGGVGGPRDIVDSIPSLRVGAWPFGSGWTTFGSGWGPFGSGWRTDWHGVSHREVEGLRRLRRYALFYLKANLGRMGVLGGRAIGVYAADRRSA